MPLLPVNSGALTVDEILPYVGEFGRFQWIVEIIFGISILPSVFPILIMYFAALDSPWKCVAGTSCPYNTTINPSDDLYDDRCNMSRDAWQFTDSKSFSILTQFDIYCGNYWMKHMTTSVIFLGWIPGAMVLGWVADNYGRRVVLLPSLAVLTIVGFATSFSPNIWVFMFLRFIIGFFTPGNGQQMFIMLSEMMGPRHRAASQGLWAAYTIALCLMGLKAYFIREWKILYMVCTAPYVFTLALCWFIPESVRWLHVHGKTDDAMDVFRRMARWNKKEIPENVTLKAMSKDLSSHKTNPLELFRTSQMTFRTLVQGYAWLVMGMVYYGLSLAADDLPGNLYSNYVLFALTEFPAIVIGMYLVNKIGRRPTVGWFIVAGCVACIIVAFIPNQGTVRYFRVVLGIFGKFAVTLAFDSMYTWSVELHPTSLRAEGMGFLLVMSRIGAATSPWMAKGLKSLNKMVPFIAMGVLGLVGGIILFWLPETRGKATQEVVDENGENKLIEDETTRDELTAIS